MPENAPVFPQPGVVDPWPVFRLPLPTFRAARSARSFTAARLVQLLPESPARAEAIEQSELVVGELVANAVRASRGLLELTLQVEADLLRITVSDDGPGKPTPRHAATSATDGRGLTIVDAVARGWGCEIAGGTKHVWAELELPQPPETATA